MDKQIQQKNIEGIKMKCSFCDYEWTTMSQMQKVSCPSCLNKNQIPQITKGGIKVA